MSKLLHARPGRARVTHVLAAVLIVLASCLIAAVAGPAPAFALTTTAQISPGGQSACAIQTGGAAYCWGDNLTGELGNGTTTSSNTPVLVSGGHTWASISAESVGGGWGGDTCGITTGGAAYCWGANWSGDLGDGTTTERATPTLVSGGYTWAEISVNYGTTCGVTSTGAGYCWGGNATGNMGDGTTNAADVPTAISGGHTWAELSEGKQMTCGVTTTGAGYCWGWFEADGDGTTNEYHTPNLVSGGYTWAHISIGGHDACGTTTAGVGYCWGSNWQGEVGAGDTNTGHHVPTAVLGGHTWSSIVESFNITCGITTVGAAYCWGSGSAGQLGDGATSDVNTPTAVLGGLTFSSIARGSGDDNTGNANVSMCGITTVGIAYCWGLNDNGQLGNESTTNSDTPVQVSVLYGGVDNTTLSVTVDPSFTFTVANQSSACNGESNFVSGAGTASAVALGHLAAGANVSGGQALSVAGNAGNGFVVYVRGTQASQNLRNGAHNWTDVSGTYASPAVLGAGEQFGYTYKDATTSSSVTNPASANFIAVTNATTNAVMGSGSSVTGSGCVSYDARTSGTTPAGSYSATVIYTAIPTF